MNEETGIRRTGKRTRVHVEQATVLNGFPATPAYKKKLLSLSDTPLSGSKHEYVVWSDSPLGREFRRAAQRIHEDTDEIEGFAQRLARAGAIKSPITPKRRHCSTSTMDTTPLASWLFPQTQEDKDVDELTEEDSNQKEIDDENLNNILDEMDAAYTEAEKEYHKLTTPDHRIRRRLNPKESPDVGSPFTEDSWNLLEQMELAASQRPSPKKLETEETLDVVDFDAFDAVDLDQLERQALERLDKNVH